MPFSHSFTRHLGLFHFAAVSFDLLWSRWQRIAAHEANRALAAEFARARADLRTQDQVQLRRVFLSLFNQALGELFIIPPTFLAALTAPFQTLQCTLEATVACDAAAAQLAALDDRAAALDERCTELLGDAGDTGDDGSGGGSCGAVLSMLAAASAACARRSERTARRSGSNGRAHWRRATCTAGARVPRGRARGEAKIDEGQKYIFIANSLRDRLLVTALASLFIYYFVCV